MLAAALSGSARNTTTKTLQASRRGPTSFMPNKVISVGGQAVIEGVMMRSPTYYATAVRTPQGRIVIQKNKFQRP